MFRLPVFKTIFGKLVFIFVLILVFSFSVTGVILYYFLNNLVTDEKVKSLEQAAENINIAFNIYLQNRNNPLLDGYLGNTLDTHSRHTESMIWIVKKDGHIVYTVPEMSPHLWDALADQTGFPKLPDERQYKRVMSGHESIIKEIGSFYGFFNNDILLFKDYRMTTQKGESWLTIEKPLITRGEDGREEINWAVYLHTPVPKIKQARWTVFRFFMISVSVSLAIGIILIYVFSIRFSRPLKQIRNAARVIAGGEFQKRLNINSQDEIGELAKSFNYMASELQNLEEMRRGFVANVSHELRTPMTSIRGFIEGILDGTIPPERQKDYLNIVRDETNRLNRLVNNLLDMARMESGEMNLSLKSFNINELIRRSIIKLESLIVQKDINIEAHFEEEDIFVYADSDAIERVIINLLHNAIKFTGENGIISISTRYQKGRILVSVRDSGIGIDSNDIAHIWERFYKTDKSRGKDKTGTGLGLAIVKSIISEHRQDIWVESEPGKGTCFTFTLDKAYGNDV